MLVSTPQLHLREGIRNSWIFSQRDAFLRTSITHSSQLQLCEGGDNSWGSQKCVQVPSLTSSSGWSILPFGRRTNEKTYYFLPTSFPLHTQIILLYIRVTVTDQSYARVFMIFTILLSRFTNLSLIKLSLYCFSKSPASFFHQICRITIDRDCNFY